MSVLKGFKQVSLSTYSGLTEDAKKGYLWFVRDTENSIAEIYLGTRKYAELNQDSEKVTNIINSLGNAVNEDGTWLGFLPIAEHEIIGSASGITDALELLETFALGLRTRISTAESGITNLQSEVALKANSADVYTTAQTYNKTEIDSKIAGAFKFMGEAIAISEDKTKITVQSGATTVEITASEENRGHVYQIAEKEYASNGSKWVELGFNIDLSAYAKKTYVDEQISAVTADIDALEGRIDVAEADIDALEGRVGTTAMPESGKTISETLVDFMTVTGDDAE